jgi:hypothetical protein
LLASAWLDERCGVTGALPALHGWFTDAGRFSPDWIASVSALLDELDSMHPTP